MVVDDEDQARLSGCDACDTLGEERDTSHNRTLSFKKNHPLGRSDWKNALKLDPVS